MRSLRSSLRCFPRDSGGSTMVEFAFVVTPLFMILLGLTDFGYRMYVDSVVEGTVHRAARLATVGDKTSDQVDDFVRTQLAEFSTNGTVTITKTNYYQYAGINKPEKLTTDANGDGIWETGDCYQDLNGDGKWNAVAGRDGLGGSDDIVYYTVQFSYPRVVPLGSMFGWSNTQTATAVTIMRNQPYASQTIPSVICTSS